MKVLLSWLREFAPIEGDPVALGEQMSDLGMAVESIDHLGRGPRRHRRGPGARPAPAPQRRQDPAGRRRRRRRRGAADLLRRLQHGRRRPRAAGHARHRDAQRHEDRAPQAAGRVVERHALLGPRARAGRRPRGHPGPRPGARRRAPTSRTPSASSTTCSTTSRSTRTGPTPCRWPAWPATWRPGSACRSPSWLPSVTPAAATLAGRASVEIVDPELCGRFFGRVLDDITIGPSPPWLADRLHRARHAPDQLRGRRVELRDARAGPAQPHLRPGQAAARLPAGALGARRRDASSRSTASSARWPTGDGVIADGDDVAVGIAGVMGGASTEISDTTTSVLLEMAWWHPMTIARSSKRLEPAQRGVGPLRAGLRPRDRRAGRAALRRAAARRPARRWRPGPSTSTATARPASRSPVRTARVNAILGTDLTAAAHHRPAAPHRLRGGAGRGRRRLRAARDRADASGPTPAPRST